MNIGVIGSGTMGIGIAQVASANGCNVFCLMQILRKLKSITKPETNIDEASRETKDIR